jgi:hypothetical protein
MAQVEAIGGHPGMDVLRLPGGLVMHVARPGVDDGKMTGTVGADLYAHNDRALKNAVRIQRHIHGAGFAPMVVDAGDGWVLEEDIGNTEPVVDGEAFRRNCVKVLAKIRAKDVRHGDLNGPNLIIRDDWPWVVDWTEAHLIGEPAPQKSPFSDSHLLWRSVAGTPGPDGQCDTPRVARRWLAILGALGATSDLGLPLRGKTFLDLGCFQGDFVAAAAVEGMDAHGLDRGGFRTGEDSITIGRYLWSDMPRGPFGRVTLLRGDIMEPGRLFAADVVMMFSTWPYIVQEHGWEVARALLGRIMVDCGVLFFETQLAGDGPGPVALETDQDVERMLSEWGHVEHLVRIPVTGRPAERSVWQVTPR